MIQYNPVKCISPPRLLTEANKQSVIINYSYPAIEETIAMFSCDNVGYVLTGPSTSTCMRNGEWVPDPRQVQCEGNVAKTLHQCNSHVMYYNNSY